MTEVQAPSVPSFPAAEYAMRLERARMLMDEQQMDALLVSSEGNFRYFTGDITLSPFQMTRPKFFVLPLVGEPCAIVAQGAEIGLGLTTWLKDIRTWPAPRPADDGVSLVADTLRSAAKRFGRVGTELGPESRMGFPVNDFLRIRELVEPVRFVDAEQPVMRRLRMIKSPAEVAKVRTICRIVSEGFEALPPLLSEGDTEWGACRKLELEIMKRGATKTFKLTGLSGPGGYNRTNTGPTDRVLGRGDVLFIDTGCQFDHYWCDFDRHFAFGPPSDATRRAYELVWRATEAGIAAVRPGRPVSDVWRAMADVVASGGADALKTKVGRMGHSMGLVLPEPPSINETDHTIIEAGMILNIEPGAAYIAPEDGGRRIMLHEENVAVTEHGCEILSKRAPREIPVSG
ncbi:MAG: aminopeptidase P family protein [Proteobacteria bacterium]|nr:aminopeptidase P family protein [Pseudomonadota bacterium]MBI3499650.1 aminopeptidase P family protein [Pseudomonadota bacterium]